MEKEGKVIEVMPTETGEGKNGTWSKNGFAIEYNDGDYVKQLYFSGFGKVVPTIEALQQGNMVKVFFNAESRSYNGRWYTDLKAWKIKLTDTAFKNPTPSVSDAVGSVDDLPF